MHYIFAVTDTLNGRGFFYTSNTNVNVDINGNASFKSWTRISLPGFVFEWEYFNVCMQKWLVTIRIEYSSDKDAKGRLLFMRLLLLKFAKGISAMLFAKRCSYAVFVNKHLFAVILTFSGWTGPVLICNESMISVTARFCCDNLFHILYLYNMCCSILVMLLLLLNASPCIAVIAYMIPRVCTFVK